MYQMPLRKWSSGAQTSAFAWMRLLACSSSDDKSHTTLAQGHSRGLHTRPWRTGLWFPRDSTASIVEVFHERGLADLDPPSGRGEGQIENAIVGDHPRVGGVDIADGLV